MADHSQPSGRPTTPFGPSARYTVRFHVIGEARDDRGGFRGVDRHVEYRVVTPHGDFKAVATAALMFSRQEPGSMYREVEIVDREAQYVVAPEDWLDFDAQGR